MTDPQQPQEVPEEATQDAIDWFLAAFPGATEADARTAWAAAREVFTDEEGRLRRNAAVLNGILIALADDHYADANTLIAGLDPIDMPDAIRQLGGLLIPLPPDAPHTT